MGFLAPVFLLGAIAAAVPIVLHLLRREPEARVRFAAVRMLRHAPVEHADKRRLRELLLLAMRVAALLLLAFAFARPFVSASTAGLTAGVTVVALDTSYSLSAPGRFARAQSLARQAIDAAPRGHLVAVVTFGDGAQVQQPAAADRALARAAVDAARVGFGATRYRAALSMAADVVAGRTGRVVVVTDLQANGWDRGEQVALPDRVDVDVADVGAPAGNLAVTAVRVAGERMLVTVRNAGAEARTVRLQLTVDGAAAGEMSGSVDAGQSSDFAMPAPTGTAALVAVDDPEGIQSDNARYLVLSASARPTVLVVSNAGDLGRDAFYVQQALLATGADGATYDVDGASGAEVSGWDETRLATHAAIVLVSTRGLDQRGRDLVASYVRSGGGVLVAGGTDVDAQVAAGATGATFEFTELPPAPGVRSLAPADLRHPVFRSFAAESATLGLVRFRQIVVVRGTGCQALARFSSGEPALQECPSGEGRVLVFASDLDGRWNDFPVHATFLPFLHETVAYLAGGPRRPSTYLVSSVPAGVPAEPGVHRIPSDGERTGVAVAVNVDVRESDLARLTVDEFQAAVTPLQTAQVPAGPQGETQQQEARQNLWKYAILLMMACLVAESLLSARAG
ncbi:MAG: BatA domain-containing protein [Vicinamibacterales bacterium]